MFWASTTTAQLCGSAHRRLFGGQGSRELHHQPLKHLHRTAPFRVVALESERENTWHRYVTNAPPEKLSAENMTASYASRWEVELLFKELKSGYCIEDIGTTNPTANLCLIYSALLTLIISRRLQRVLGAATNLRHRSLPHDRWWRLFSTVASEVMSICLHQSRRKERLRNLLDFLETEAPTPVESLSPSSLVVPGLSDLKLSHCSFLSVHPKLWGLRLRLASDATGPGHGTEVIFV